MLKIAIVVQGRFHMFDLGREILKQGHEIHLFTNYPPWMIEKFGIPRNKTTIFWFHGGLSKFLSFYLFKSIAPLLNDYLNKIFGKWALKEVKKYQPKEGWNAILCMSGIAEDLFLHYKKTKTFCVLHRGSTHIMDQYNILIEENNRTGIPVELPSKWGIDREEREYELADLIRVQSPFSLNGFIKMGISTEKVDMIPLGVNNSKFSATEEEITKRINRIKEGNEFRILGVGNFSMQKGAWDIKELVNLLPDNIFKFRHVGKITQDGKEIAKSIGKRIDFIGKVPQEKLPQHYAWGDIFLLPSLQDGFAVVVPQALACRLPTLVSENTGSSFLIQNGINGWIVPIRAPKAMAEIIEKLHKNPEKLINMIQTMNLNKPPKTWSETATMTILDIEQRSTKKIIEGNS